MWCSIFNARNPIVLCYTVLYSTVQYSTVQYSTVQYSTVQYSTVQYTTVHCSTHCTEAHLIRSSNAQPENTHDASMISNFFSNSATATSKLDANKVIENAMRRNLEEETRGGVAETFPTKSHRRNE